MPNLGNITRPAYVYDAETDTWLPIGVGAHSHDQIPASIVDAKGDLIVGTAADTVQRRAVGADGSYLIADSTQTTGLNWAGPSNIAGKNAIINGGMDIWQRGTSVSQNASTTAYTSDRWSCSTPANGATTISRQTTDDTVNLPFIQYCARVQRNSGQTGTAGIAFQQNFESTNSIPFAGKSVTFSFYARAGANYSPTNNALAVYLFSGTGTDQNISAGFTNQTAVINQTATLTTNWQRFSYTATVGATAKQIATYFLTSNTGTAGTNDYYEITGVQLELGSTATPFSRACGNIQQELAACQRYYFRYGGNAVYEMFGGGQTWNNTNAAIQVKSPVTMRIPPTSVEYSTLYVGIYGAVGGGSVTSLSQLQGSRDVHLVQANVTPGNFTANTWYQMFAANSTSAYIAFSAEL
jgi:hypothetical protein